MNPINSLNNQCSEIEKKIGYSFKDKNMLTLSFIHRSFVNENKDVEKHNERLEFLGDAVLGLIISEFLYRTMPQGPEGELSRIRSNIVEASACFAYLEKLNIEQYLLLGKGEQKNEGRGRESILADLFEAVLGAIYLDGGIEAARTFIFSHFEEDIDAILMRPLQNWKAQLQDYCQKKFQVPPVYKVMSESGPDHDKRFEIAVMIGDENMGEGSGPSKKEAQQQAAKKALAKILELE